MIAMRVCQPSSLAIGRSEHIIVPAQHPGTEIRIETRRIDIPDYGAVMQSALKTLVGTGRFELPTCRLGGDRSIHLSYVPAIGSLLILKHFKIHRVLVPASRTETVAISFPAT